MDGASFLAQVRQRAPDTIRILLTGFADVGAAIAAVNEGQIFRFLTKPCASPVLRTAIDAGIEQNRLITAERVLLEQTLRGSVRMLVDALALANPTAYGRAVRIKNYATELADAVGVTQHWRINIAAMLSQVGAIALPADVSRKLARRLPLDPEERMQVERLPSVAAALLENVPRLDDIRAILRISADGAVNAGAAHLRDDVQRDASILMIADAFELEEAQGATPAHAIASMRASEGFDAGLLDEFARLRGDARSGPEVRDIPLRYVQEGMQLAADVRTAEGEILLPRGLEITLATIARILSMPADLGKTLVPVRITLP
jgi:CheY-like chemotaxis protein